MAKILVCEDEEGLRKLYDYLLTKRGHEVVLHEDGKQATPEYLKEHSIDLLITDLVMPNREGLSTIQHVRRADPEFPIICISGGLPTRRSELLNMAANAGASALVPKPFKNQDLIEILEEFGF